jgi:ABC transport system ATP-binding/permease protein
MNWAKESKRITNIEFPELSSINPQQFTADIAVAAEIFIEQLKSHYNTEFSEANNYKEQWLNHNISQRKELFEQTKDNYYNESISDIVCKVFEKNKILRDHDILIQMVDPIYMMPEPESAISFRTHFFAPKKHFLGTYFETLWFNITMVWIFTAFLYAILYFDLLKKLLDKLADMKLFKK